ncbi:hypothetical protein [Pacificoceanicola onchidii]|uniref:hypothetical protein n=1 Tax=Pacificoceanicola onchidii TaxID=2562685 RepID=UPI001455E77C|nr:hypothetical protein [Pacificoceanicola onchidii]
MKPLVFAAVLSLGAAAASAGVPTMSLPDLTFPPSAPDVSTQGCVPATEKATQCQ